MAINLFWFDFNLSVGFLSTRASMNRTSTREAYCLGFSTSCSHPPSWKKSSSTGLNPFNISQHNLSNHTLILTTLSSAEYYRFQYLRFLFPNCVPLVCMTAITHSSPSESGDYLAPLLLGLDRRIQTSAHCIGFVFYLYYVCITNMACIFISVSNYFDGKCIETTGIAPKSITK